MNRDKKKKKQQTTDIKDENRPNSTTNEDSESDILDEDGTTPISSQLSINRMELERSTASRRSFTISRTRSGSHVSQKGQSLLSYLANSFGIGRNKESKNELIQLEKEINTLRIKEKELDDKLNQATLKNESLSYANTNLTEELRTIEKIAETYKKKLDSLPEVVVHYTKISSQNTQIGSSNTLSVPDSSELNELLLAYHESLDAGLCELNIVSEKLDTSLKNEERSSEEIRHLRRIIEEIHETLNEVKESQLGQPLSLLEYTIQLTNPQGMIEACVNTLRDLPADHDYNFDELPDKGKLGVLRILKKYCQSANPRSLGRRQIMTLSTFSREMYLKIEEVAEDKLHLPLQKDDCACLLVKWVHLSLENDAAALVDIFPRIKHFGTVRGPFGCESIGVVTSSMLDVHSSDFATDMKATIESRCNELKVMQAQSTLEMRSAYERSILDLQDAIRSANEYSKQEIKYSITAMKENKNVEAVDAAVQATYESYDIDNSRKWKPGRSNSV